MSNVHLGGLSRYERRIRNLWSAEPQRGDWTEADDNARTSLAAESAVSLLDFWAKVVGSRNLTMPSAVGSFVYHQEWFDILGMSVVAFPSAAIRDAFVDANARAEAIPDDAFWP